MTRIAVFFTTLFSLRHAKTDRALRLADEAVATGREVRRTAKQRNGAVKDLEATLKAMSEDLRK